jgi:hypothetical protein
MIKGRWMLFMLSSFAMIPFCHGQHNKEHINIYDYSLLSKRNKKPPAMRVENKSYTKNHRKLSYNRWCSGHYKKKGMVSLWLKV